MKIATKVFIWISIVVCSIYELFIIMCFGFDFAKSSNIFVGLFLILLIPIVVGGCSLYKLSTCDNKKQLIAIGVITIIFCSPLGGAFMIGIPENELKKPPTLKHFKTVSKTHDISNNENNVYTEKIDDCFIETNQNNKTEDETNQHNLKKENSKQQDLDNLKELFDNGIIDQDEYKTTALKIINKKY